MAIGIVDRLEVIDVEHHHRHRLARLGNLQDLAIQVRVHVAPVVDPRERVCVGHGHAALQHGTQLVVIASPTDLRAGARQQFVPVDRLD